MRLRMNHFVHTSVTYVEYPSVCGFGPAQYQLHIPLQATESAQAGLPGCATPTCISGRRQAGAQSQRRARKRWLQAARQIPLFLCTRVAEWMEFSADASRWWGERCGSACGRWGSERRQKGGHRPSTSFGYARSYRQSRRVIIKGSPTLAIAHLHLCLFVKQFVGKVRVSEFCVPHARSHEHGSRGDFRKSCLLEVD